MILDDTEHREIQRAARRQRMTVSAWVRQALRTMRRRQPSVDTDKKLAVVHAASHHDFPTCDIEQMLAEIERGYFE